MAIVLKKVISGGQTGADQAGLRAAQACGLTTGGHIPRGFLTQAGPNPTLGSLYGLVEHKSSAYPPRTALNAKESDGTIRFARDWTSRGEILTLRMVSQYKKPYLDVTVGKGCHSTPEEVVEWLDANNIETLNVAGNSEKTAPGIGFTVERFLYEVFQIVTKGTKPL